MRNKSFSSNSKVQIKKLFCSLPLIKSPSFITFWGKIYFKWTFYCWNVLMMIFFCFMYEKDFFCLNSQRSSRLWTASRSSDKYHLINNIWSTCDLKEQFTKKSEIFFFLSANVFFFNKNIFLIITYFFNKITFNKKFYKNVVSNKIFIFFKNIFLIIIFFSIKMFFSQYFFQ